jgi:hypothetical protein
MPMVITLCSISEKEYLLNCIVAAGERTETLKELQSEKANRNRRLGPENQFGFEKRVFKCKELVSTRSVIKKAGIASCSPQSGFAEEQSLGLLHLLSSGAGSPSLEMN